MMSDPIPIPTGSTPVTTARTDDPDRAQHVVGELFLPHRLDLGTRRESLDVRIAGLRLAGMTVGRLSYGRTAQLTTAEADHFHVNTPLSGQARSSGGWPGQPVVTAPGTAAVFGPGRPARIAWSADCDQLCLMISRTDVETELEILLGRSLRAPLQFEPAMDLRTQTAWREVLGMLVRELEEGPGLVSHPSASRHVRGLVIDGLLLGQHHTYTEQLDPPGRAAPRSAIAHAMDLVRDNPEEAWSTVRLAAEVHLSVRALQEGFRRDADASPQSYVRSVRLRLAHDLLREADPDRTTVAQVAARCGMGHLGRFAASYRDAFGELPSDTLKRV